MVTATRERVVPFAHPIERRFPIRTSLPASKVRAYRKRVERGATDLDERQPAWWRHIKLTRLDMSHGAFDTHSSVPDCGCIAAQLARYYTPRYSDLMGRIIGEYDFWLDRIGLTSFSKGRRSQVAYGYILPLKDWHSDRDIGAWNLLDQLWANEVRKRREG